MDESSIKEALRRKLNITWSDEDTEARLDDILSDGMAEIKHKVGLPDTFDFSTPGQERKLLLSWCLYEWNHATNEFDMNYANDVMQLRQKWEVEAYKEEQDAAETEQV